MTSFIPNASSEIFPPTLPTAARDLFSARCIVFAFLFDTDETIRSDQEATVLQWEGEPSLAEAKRLASHLAYLDPRFRLPVFEILQGTLTGMSPEQYQHFRKTVDSFDSIRPANRSVLNFSCVTI